MFGQVQVLVFLFAVTSIAAAEDGPSSFPLEFSEEYLGSPRENDVANKVPSAKIDKLFDAMLPTVRRLMLLNGMDPMKMEDFSINLLPLPGKLKGTVDLTNGWLQELSKMKRTQHVIMTYSEKRLVLEMNLGFDVLDFNYSYYLRYLLVKRVGDVYGRFRNLDCRVLVTVDLENYKIYLDSIKFRGVGKFDLKFEGRLFDPLLNAVTKAVTTVFERQVLGRMEERGLKIFRKVTEDINERIPLPDRLKKPVY